MNKSTTPQAPELFHPNPGMTMRPDLLPPSAWTGHVPFGAWLVWALRPRVLVELGTHHGTSYLGFCQAVEASGAETRCFAVDTWAGDEHSGAYDNVVYDTLRRYHDARYARFSELLRMTFDEALASVADGTVDLLHIDGLHTYDAVRHDFESWQPKLSNRAVVLFHDIHVRDRGFGVWRLWDELRARFPAFEFVHSHGLGVLLVGTDVPPAVRDLARLGEAERGRVQVLFERLGEGLVQRARVEELEEAVAGREEGVQAYRTHATALEAQVDALQREEAELRRQLGARQSELDALRGTVASLRNDLAERQVGLEQYRTHAHALEVRLAEVDAEASAARASVAEACEAMRIATEARERMAATFAAATAEMVREHAKAVDALARQHAAAIEEMQRQLADARAEFAALSADMQRMLQSRSWRATAWLRKLSSLLRGQA